MFKGGTLKLGDVVIEHPLTMVSTDKHGSGVAESFPSNVGGGVLKRFVVTFDYDHSTMYLRPITGHVEDLDTLDMAGMWINAQGGGFKVLGVSRGGPADQAGLHQGDVIVAADGKPASRIHLYDMRRNLRDRAPGTVVNFTVRTANGTHDVRVTLRELI